MVSWGSVPVADPDVLRVWGAGTGLDQLLQAHQERGPLRAAVGHELDRLAPALVLEQDDRVVALPLQVEADVGADPLRGAVGHLPLDPLVRALVEHLHVESAGVTEAELDRAADDAVTHGVSGPPGGEAVSCRERVVHLLRSGGRPDAVQDVNHDRFPRSYSNQLVAIQHIAINWLRQPRPLPGRRPGGGDGAGQRSHCADAVAGQPGRDPRPTPHNVRSRGFARFTTIARDVRSRLGGIATGLVHQSVQDQVKYGVASALGVPAVCRRRWT